MDHSIDRYRKGRVSAGDFIERKHWLESGPDVPVGMWYRRFAKFALAGEGDMAVRGEEVHQ